MKILPSLTPDLTEWALKQPLFYVASAPTYGQHVNVSPKGLASTSLAILSPNRIAYLDRTGSGCETIAHLYENGRLTVMFNSFGAAPRILRLFCHVREVVERTDEDNFAAWLERLGMPSRPDGARSVIVLDVFKVTTSCGFAVPMVKRQFWDKAEGGEAELAVFEERPTLNQYAAKKEELGKIFEYQIQNNVVSLDGLPGLKGARKAHPDAKLGLLPGHVRAYAGRVLSQHEGMVVGFLAALLLWVLMTAVTGGSFKQFALAK
ncbi:hypothetical protein MCOR25_010817 [Pyricularia grisea]|uniref:Pyridoxamine 5'-phosphate oxidase putative domain-containing protein n=1 Tax=Pyricularia grisea TaxID=148305 RepID=A0A6P8B0Y1_PYRGI|nr:uncharacterized protein PgNI_07016 [Pyricularia grisea]KAI6348347.1 hypothetical protein MCOR25_010817 [Pyricularia grisea]TLD08494.1 hypothetical protein PgNI_07016 [Pyricularia grisea]